MRLPIALSIGTAGLALLWATGAASLDPAFTIVMKDLDNPRGLAFDRHGSLFVAEAGEGRERAMDPINPGEGFCFPAPAGGTRCYGPTGAIKRLKDGIEKRIATGLPSHAFRSGGGAIGPHDLSFAFGGQAVVTMGLEADPAFRDQLVADQGTEFPEVELFGHLVRMNPKGKWRPLVDIAASERDGGPVPPQHDSNPYGLLGRPVWPQKGDHEDGQRESDDHEQAVDRHDRGDARHDEGENDDDDDESIVLTDAGANALLRVNEEGDIATLGVFPSRTTVPPRSPSTDAVPTSVSIGPDGAYYISELVGIPFFGPTRPSSNIYRLAREEGAVPTVFLTGFNAVIDFAFRGSDLYVVQNWSASPTSAIQPGRLIRVTCGGTPFACDPATATTVLQLERPTSVAIGPDGAIYVTRFGTSKDIGEVLRIEP